MLDTMLATIGPPVAAGWVTWVALLLWDVVALATASLAGG